MHRLSRLPILVVLALVAGAAPARADWLVIPFAGTAFGGEAISVLNLERGSNNAKTVFGVTGVWLTESVVGFEGEFLFGPSFFERGAGTDLLVRSYVSTLSGGLVVTTPLAVTRESLRPYVVAGIGTMQASADYTVDFLDQDRWFTTLHLGGGAMASLSPDTGVRFDIRHINSLNRVTDEVTQAIRPRLRFWRFTMGAVIRIG